MTLAVSLRLTARILVATPLQLLRNERLGRVLVRARPGFLPCANVGLPVGVAGVAHRVDGRSGTTLTPGLPAKVLDQNAEDLTAVVDHLVATAVIDHAGIGTTDVDAVAGALPTLREPVDLVPRVGRAGTVCAARIIGSPRRRRDGLGPTGPTGTADRTIARSTCSTSSTMTAGTANTAGTGRGATSACTARCTCATRAA